MTVKQLADYLISHDFEVQIINRQYDLIALQLTANGVHVGHRQIVQAVSVAAEDPYISLMADGKLKP